MAKKHILLGILMFILLIGSVKADLTDDLIFWFSCENSTLIKSNTWIESENNPSYAGLLNDNVYLDNITGKVGSGCVFDGNNDFVNINKSIPNVFNRSVSVWFKTNVDNDQQFVFHENAYMSSLWLLSTGWMRAFYSGSPYEEFYNEYSTGEWYHIVMTFDYLAQMKHFYINGTLINSTNVSNVDVGSLDIDWSEGTTNSFNGVMDEFVVYSRTLTSDDIIKLYNDGDGVTYDNMNITPSVYAHAKDGFSNENLSHISILINGTVYSTNSGNVEISMPSTELNAEFDGVIVDSGDNDGYFTQEFNGINFSNTVTFNLTNSHVELFAQDFFSSALNSFYAIVNSINHSTTNGSISINFTKSNMDVTVGSEDDGGYTTTSDSFSVAGNTTTTHTTTLNPFYGVCYVEDSYSGESLSTISALVDSVLYSSTNGTNWIPFAHYNDYNTLQNNLVVDAHDNNGYFTQTFSSVNFSSVNFNLTNVQVRVNATTEVGASPIGAITVQVNSTNITSVGGIAYLNITEEDNVSLIVYANGYNHTTETLTATGNNTYEITSTLNKLLDVIIYREFDNSPFDFTYENNMTLIVLCDNAEQPFNITSNNQTINIVCNYTGMILNHQNQSTSYFRTLIPEENATSVDWYMLNFNYDVGVQVILNLVDLTGDYNQGTIELKRYFYSTPITVIKQRFDIENSVNLYLLKGAQYTLEICNDAGRCRSIGNLIGDVAEEKTIYIPDIDFFPQDSVIGDNVTWLMNWTPNNRIQFTYNDKGQDTTYIEFLIFSGSNTTNLYYNNTVSTHTLTATYVIPAAYVNTSFIGCFYATHPSLEKQIHDCKSFFQYDEPFGVWDGFNAEERYKTTWWGALMFLALIILLFSRWSIKAGLVTTNFFFWLFIQFGWLLTYNKVYDYLILSVCVVLSIIYIIALENKGGGV